MDDRLKELEAQCDALERENARLKAELAEAHDAIKNFADSQRWAHQAWKDQPAIKPLFDIAGALAEQGE